MKHTLFVLAVPSIALVLLPSAHAQTTKLPYRADGWTLDWSEEFDKPGLPDPSLWSFEVGFVRNHEPQYYTDARPENCWITNGILTITARKEPWPNKDYGVPGRGWRTDVKEAKYTSADLSTSGKRTFQYGRLEIRAQMPKSKGAWPALWTLGQSISSAVVGEEAYYNWPACGEIDILEIWCNNPNRVTGGLHTSLQGFAHVKKPDGSWGPRPPEEAKAITNKRNNAPHWAFGGGDLRLPDDQAPWNGFHTYTLDWDENDIWFYYDGRQYGHAAIGRSDWPDGQNPFRKPHFLLINLALGGYGNPVEEGVSVFPMEMKVDWVRHYVRAEDR